MIDKKEVNEKNENTSYSLNDDRRVRVLSPGALVVKRFFRNRLGQQKQLSFFPRSKISNCGGGTICCNSQIKVL